MKRKIDKGAPKQGEEKRTIPPPPPKSSTDISIPEPVGISESGAVLTGLDRLSFDGYALTWHGANPKSWVAFSGLADESANEAVKDIGPTPQGLYTVDPANIETWTQPSDDWGLHRVKIEPLAATLKRMVDCLKVVRNGMYIHGGSQAGTHGCIELNDDRDEEDFFSRLKKYGKRIELEVLYVGKREQLYEVSTCPYP